MLPKELLKKLFLTSTLMLLILSIYTIPYTQKRFEHTLRTNLEIEDITSIPTEKIYLKDSNNYLVQVEIMQEEKPLEDKIVEIIKRLKMNKSQNTKQLSGYIPEETKLYSQTLEENNLTLNFSKDIFEKGQEEFIITGLVYSLLELNGIKSISIMIDNVPVKEYQSLTKEIGINKEYLFENRKDIHKIVLYYLDNTDTYYVPVTRYVNDNRKKIEVIIDELKQTKKNLISYLKYQTELIDYKEEANVLFLNFNEAFMDENNEVMEKTFNTIAYSVFDNYDVNTVMFEVNHKNIKYIVKK